MDVTPASRLASPRLVPVGDLHPWDKNPRTIRPKRFENLRRGIAADPEFLRLRPILARTDSLIYCGNQRYLAAVANGATAVPAILEDVDERTMRERAIRDNEQWASGRPEPTHSCSRPEEMQSATSRRTPTGSSACERQSAVLVPTRWLYACLYTACATLAHPRPRPFANTRPTTSATSMKTTNVTTAARTPCSGGSLRPG